MVFLFVNLCLKAQKPNYPLKRYNVQTINFEQGLINNFVTDIVTDTFGFTWVSTLLGIQRYNGNILSNITPIVKKDTIRINSTILFLKLKNGMLWIAHSQGILEYNPFTDSYKNIVFNKIANVSTLQYIPIKQEARGAWFLYGNTMLLCLNVEDGSILERISLANAPALAGKTIITDPSQITSNDNYIFLKENDGNVCKVNLNTHEINTINLPEKNIQSIECNTDKLYALSSQALTYFDLQKNKWVNRINFKSIANDVIITKMRFTGSNQILLSLDNHLFQLDTFCTFKKELVPLMNMTMLPQGFIAKIYNDQFNRIWLITNDDIKKVQNTDIPFQTFLYPDASNNFIRSLYYDEQKGLLLAGCYNGGLQLYDSSGNALWKFPLITKETKNILSIEKIKPNFYLIITFSRGWFILNPRAKTLTPFAFNIPDKQNSFPTFLHFPNNIQRISDSTLIVASPQNIYNCIFKNGLLKTLTPYFHSDDKIDNNMSACMMSSSGTLWVGTQTGTLYRSLHGKTLPLINLKDNFIIRSIAEDSTHHIWVGTDKGLYIFTEQGAMIKRVGIENGLRNDCIYSLLPDGKKAAMFAGTNLGISRITLDGKINNYTKENGLQDNEFNTQSSTVTASGRLFFGGVKGISAFYPQALNVSNDKPSLIIYRAEVNSEPFKQDSSIWASHKINLHYFENKISFSVAAIGLQNANDYQYEYMMENYDNYWSVTNTPVNIHYSLSPGNYRFRVRIAGLPATEKDELLSIAFPFWRRWWFYILSAFVVFSIFFLVARFFYNRKYNRRLEELKIKQQIYHERERISRDLHDNLGAYTSAITTQVDDIVQQYSEKNNPAVKQLKSTAGEIMLQLRDTIWALNKENITVTMLSDRIKNYINKISPSYPLIQFDVEEKIITQKSLASVNGLHIFRIMQETIHNAIKHSGCSSIKVIIFSDKRINISIEDDGKGMPEEIINSGNGLQNIKERAKEINWELNFFNEKGGGLCVTLNGDV